MASVARFVVQVADRVAESVGGSGCVEEFAFEEFGGIVQTPRPNQGTGGGGQGGYAAQASEVSPVHTRAVRLRHWILVSHQEFVGGNGAEQLG